MTRKLTATIPTHLEKKIKEPVAEMLLKQVSVSVDFMSNVRDLITEKCLVLHCHNVKKINVVCETQICQRKLFLLQRLQRKTN